MFSFSVNEILTTNFDGRSMVYYLVSYYIKYNGTKIKITPDHYRNISINDKSDCIDITTNSYSIICSPSVLLLDFHKIGNGFNTYMEIKITKNEFNEFKSMINEINERVKQ